MVRVYMYISYSGYISKVCNFRGITAFLASDINFVGINVCRSAKTTNIYTLEIYPLYDIDYNNDLLIAILIPSQF